jgi:hypothetical protein
MGRRTIEIAGLVAGLSCVATALAQTTSHDVQISASVSSFCAISGATSGSALSTTIPVDAQGAVDTTPQTFTVGNVVCNTATSVQATSLRGGVKSANKSGPAFTNIINYRGSATFGTAKSTVNTGTIKGAAFPEQGNVETTAGATQGPLMILIRPAQPTSPLILGDDYHDTLRITLEPQ